MKYSVKQLIERFEEGEKLKYLFFWGHRNSGAEVNKTCFSQWHESSFVVNDVNYNTAEHWMMAQKAQLFQNYDLKEAILKSSKPGEAKDLGRKILGFNQEIWDVNRYSIVVQGNLQKFSQNSALKKFLIQTKNRILVEASPVDHIWSCGLAEDDERITNPSLWLGENLLGFALMEVREILIERR